MLSDMRREGGLEGRGEAEGNFVAVGHVQGLMPERKAVLV
jgi:hypothetical protein